MKGYILIISILLAALGILCCVQIWTGALWTTGLQDKGSGEFYELKQNKKDAEAFAREAFKEESVADAINEPGTVDYPTEGTVDHPTEGTVDHPTEVSEPSWKDWLPNIIKGWLGATTRVGGGRPPRPALPRPAPPRPAPPGVYFTLTYLSVRSRSGITNLMAGTQVVCVKDQGAVLLVKAGKFQFEVKRQYLTNDLNLADLAVRNDAVAQQAVASYIAQQQQAIDQRGDKRKMPPSGQH
jgi:hypothetical protein